MDFKILSHDGTLILWFNPDSLLGKKYYMRKNSFIVPLENFTDKELKELVKHEDEYLYTLENLHKIKNKCDLLSRLSIF